MNRSKNSLGTKAFSERASAGRSRMKGIIGKKVGMTQVYDEKGTLVPVTVIEAGPCVVLDVKTQERDGYTAVQVGFGSRKV